MTSRALTTIVTGVLWVGNAAWMRSKLRITGMSRDRDSVPGREMCIPSAGIASATRTPALSSADSAGRRSTRSTIRDQIPFAGSLDFGRVSSGSRPFSTRSPSADRTAGSTVSDPSTETATTRMVPVASDEKVGEPPRYMPPIAIITVTPETSTARPDVAAAASIAAPLTRPAARSSRTRLR